MGRQRQAAQQPPQHSRLEQEIALAIALILAGRPLPSDAALGVVAGIAARLARLPGLPESDEDGAVTSQVARLVVVDRPRLVERPEATRRASTQNLSYRAHYAIEAVKRVVQNVADGEGVRAALEGERPHFSRHLDASRNRLSGARLNDAAAERFGPLLGWNHTGKSATHRPSHVAANGANYRIDSRPAATDGMLPGMAPHCDCVPGPPIEGARLLN